MFRTYVVVFVISSPFTALTYVPGLSRSKARAEA
jgi:hypothetical protein